ncbi:MAG: tetratricopeptide repeat protein [Deltaproteobacteria bacterium]|nr:MAG: tetratricopeptide repeat protein [Deltaproteobacteria bacterium]
MNKGFKKISIWLVFFLIVLAISCMGGDKRLPSNQGPILSGETNNNRDLIQFAYQNYAFACIAIANGDYEEAEIYLKEALENDKDSPYLLMKSSQVLAKNGKMEEALPFAQKTVDLTPDDQKAREFLAKIYFRLKKYDLAISQYRDILKRDPGNKEVRLHLTTLFIRLKEYDTALDELSILINNEPELVIAHYYKGRINTELKEYNSAKGAFLKALEIDSRFLPALIDLATLYSEIDKVDMAVETYKKILLLYPTNTVARERLIALYYKTGQEKLAEDNMEEMKRIFSPGDLKRKRLGLIYLRYGKLNKSIQELKSIVSAWPDDQEAKYYLGSALEENGDLAEAYKNFDLLNPNTSYFINARMHMAYILERQEKPDEAINLLKETINHKRDNPRLYLMLTSLYEIKEEYLNAMDILKEGLKYNERNTGLLYRLGVVLDKLKRNEECLEQMQMVIKIDPKHADALNYIGYTYADKGIYLDRALELIERAIRYKPNSGYIIDSLGWVYYRKGQYDKALEELKRAVELSPEDPTINEHLGDVYFKKKDYERALKIYKRALSIENADNERLNGKIKDVMERLKGNGP